MNRVEQNEKIIIKNRDWIGSRTVLSNVEINRSIVELLAEISTSLAVIADVLKEKSERS